MHIVGISAALDWRKRFWDGLLNTGQQFLLVGGDTLHPALGQEHWTAENCSRILHMNYIHIYNNLPFPTSYHRTFIWLILQILRSTRPRLSQTWKSYRRGIGKGLKIWGLQHESFKMRAYKRMITHALSCPRPRGRRRWGRCPPCPGSRWGRVAPPPPGRAPRPPGSWPGTPGPRARGHCGHKKLTSDNLQENGIKFALSHSPMDTLTACYPTTCPGQLATRTSWSYSV